MDIEIRYILRKSYIQTSQHFGDVWYIYDNIEKKQLGNYHSSHVGLDYDLENLNQEWNEELKKTEWQRNSKYFSFLHKVYRDTNYLNTNLYLNELAENKNIQTINVLQSQRAKLLLEIKIDLIEKLKVKTKLHPLYNDLLTQENELRAEFPIPILKEINSEVEYFEAIKELELWTKYFIKDAEFHSYYFN